MKVYISGPVTGLPGGNEPAFRQAAIDLSNALHEPIVPHDFVRHSSTWATAMRACIRAMMSADAVLLLDGWNASRGALIEVYIAREIGIPVYERFDDLQESRP